MPVATVLLCVRNGADTLEQQLAALSDQTFAEDWEIVLVDNGSTDDTRRIATSWLPRLPAMRIVDEARPGANWARNRGVGEARGAVVVCCDADDEVTPLWLHGMVTALEHFDVVGGPLDPEPLNGPYTPRAATLQRAELPHVFDRPYAVGANFGFRRHVWKAVGGFDSDFLLGSDEVDFCLRAQYAGFTIGFAPDAVTAYRVKDTARGVMRQRFSYGRGHQRLVEKHAGLGYVRSRPIQRWKVIVVAAGLAVARLPDLFRRRDRLQYLASVAYLGGRIVELIDEALKTGWRRPERACR